MKKNLYQRWALLTILSVVFLIGVGSLVRASGSGLGCPDCQNALGLGFRLYLLMNYRRNSSPSQFNLFKTWTEYINRLIGVLIGIFIFVTTLLSFRFRKEKPIVMWFSIAALLLVAFQGWLGSIVVATELTAWIITAHMVVAMIILLLLMFAYYASFTENGVEYILDKRGNFYCLSLFRSVLSHVFRLFSEHKCAKK